MVSYGFKSQFVPAIEKGTKLFTLRDHRINGHARAGDLLHLWEGMRTPSQRLIFGKPMPCTRSFPVVLLFEPIANGSVTLTSVQRHEKDGASVLCLADDLQGFVVGDGFETIADFTKWHCPLGLTIVKKHLISWAQMDTFEEGQKHE
jgi:hypothetical protein